MAESIIGATLTTMLGLVFAIAAAHITITKILPKVKEILAASLKSERSVSIVMFLLVFYTAVFVVEKIVELLVSFGNEYISMIAIITPGLDILISLFPYIGAVVFAAIIAFKK